MKAPEPNAPPHHSILAGVLSYLVPGLGQIVQGRVSKGMFFLVVLLGMFHAGQAMGGWRNVYMPVVENNFRNGGGRSYNPLESIYQRWHYAGQFWIGVAAWPALWQFNEMPVPSAETDTFLHDYQREPMTLDKLERQLRR